MKKVWRWIEAGFALCALGIVTVFLVYAFRMHSDGAAAWVQAVGSIAAIIGAYLFIGVSARDQRRLAMEVRDRELAERRSSLKAILDDVFVEYLDLRRWYENESGIWPLEFSFLSIDDLENASRLLDDVPLFEFDSGVLVKAILDLRRSCRRILAWLELLQSEFRSPGADDKYPGHTYVADQIKDEVDYIETVYFAALEVTGGQVANRHPMIRAFMWNPQKA